MIDTCVLPSMTIRRWSVVAAAIPRLPSQADVRSSLTVNVKSYTATVSAESSPEARPILSLIGSQDFKPGQAINITITYNVTLIARKLVPGPSPSRIPPLADAERFLYTRPTATLDFNSRPFAAWLSREKLHKSPDETDFAFGRRVYNVIKANYIYQLDDAQDRRASQICATNWSDCGGLCGLYASAMRANGVPARMLIGWTAKRNSPRGHPHVRCEFFASGIGWVPVEMSAAVYAKNKPLALSFGYDAGDFVVLHVDPDLSIPALDGGTTEVPAMQTPAHTFEGDGSTDDAVETIAWTAR